MVSAPFTNDGTISLTSGTLVIKSALSGTGKALTPSGTVLDLTAGGALSEAISGAGTLQLDSAAFLLSANSITAGTVKLDTGAGLSGHGTLAGKLADMGVLTASGGTLQVDGVLSGTGTIAAAASGSLVVAGGGNFAGAISGAGKVFLDGATTLDTGVSLSASSVLAEASVTLASVSVTNTAADRFVLYATSGKTVTLGATGSGAFSNLGTLVAEEPGTAVVSAPFTNDGTASVTAGSLSFLSDIAGTGMLEIGASSTLSLELGTGSGQVVDFLSTSGVLDLFNPLDFAGTITGFAGSDQIFLETASETGFSYAGNILTVKDSATTVASLHFTGSSNSFSLANENSGVLIKFG